MIFRLSILVSLFVVNLTSINAAQFKKTRTAFALTKSMTIQELKETASIIFRGKFQDFKEIELNGLEARALKFEVKEVFRGLKSNKKKLILHEWAQVRSPFDEDLIAADKEYVFFFYEPSSTGFTSLVGIEQGLVTVNEDKSLEFSTKLGARKVEKKQFFFFKSQKNIESYQDLKNFLDS